MYIKILCELVKDELVPLHEEAKYMNITESAFNENMENMPEDSCI